jgi:hypothetical protein
MRAEINALRYRLLRLPAVSDNAVMETNRKRRRFQFHLRPVSKTSDFPKDQKSLHAVLQ